MRVRLLLAAFTFVPLLSTAAPADPIPPAKAPPATGPSAPAAVPAPSLPSPSSPVAPVSPLDNGLPPASAGVWQIHYSAARARMIAGDFADAGRAFGVLAANAPTPFDRALVLSDLYLCAEWERRGLVFVRRADLGESTLSAKAADERTTDEIAVLYTNAVFFGIGTGVWLATLTEPKTLAGVILPSLGLAGAAAGGVALLDSGRPLRYGVPQAMVSGGFIGLEEGLAWSLWNQARASHVNEWEPSGVATVIWSLTGAGALAGGLVGSYAGTTPGRASFVGSTALWTGLTAGMVSAAFTSDEDTRDDHGLLAAAIGLNVGALAGAYAAGPVSPSIARVRFLDLGGIAGGLLFGGLYLAGANENPKDRPLLGLAALGSAAGLGVAWAATAKMPQDRAVHEAASESEARTLARNIEPTLLPVPGGAAIGLTGQLD